MTANQVRLAVGLAVLLIPSLARAQHDAHQPATSHGPSTELTQCLRGQPVIENIITAATARAEAARLSNSPSELRAAVDHLEAALRDIRAQLGPCAAAAASTDPHAGHSMPAAAPASTGTTTAKPAPSTPAKPTGSDPHAGHTAVQAGEKQMDPVSGLTVDPATAPKATYQGHTYYFSSEQSKKEFLQNPAKFAKAPKG
jgi:YHS domain-containing protein